MGGFVVKCSLCRCEITFVGNVLANPIYDFTAYMGAQRPPNECSAPPGSHITRTLNWTNCCCYTVTVFLPKLFLFSNKRRWISKLLNVVQTKAAVQGRCINNFQSGAVWSENRLKNIRNLTRHSMPVFGTWQLSIYDIWYMIYDVKKTFASVQLSNNLLYLTLLTAKLLFMLNICTLP